MAERTKTKGYLKFISWVDDVCSRIENGKHTRHYHIAKMLGVTESMMHYYYVGKRRPSLERMSLIEDLSGIPIKEWMEQ